MQIGSVCWNSQLSETALYLPKWSLSEPPLHFQQKQQSSMAVLKTAAQKSKVKKHHMTISAHYPAKKLQKTTLLSPLPQNHSNSKALSHVWSLDHCLSTISLTTNGKKIPWEKEKKKT